MKMCKVWGVLKSFKDSCQSLGWKACDDEDWIEVGGVYHMFLCAKSVHPSSFKKIVSNRRFVMKEGSSYSVNEASYTAWLFPEKLPESLVSTLLGDVAVQQKVALYDLSPLLEGRRVGVKMNYTDSLVFRKFEAFLKSEFNVDLKPFSGSSLGTKTKLIA